MQIAFGKYHGLGNDFLIVDGRDGAFTLSAAAGRALCDRARGVGADGVLLWRGSLAAPEMVVVNQDGSIAAMCGNGIRCFVKHILDNHLPAATAVTVQTGNGPLPCTVTRGADGRVVEVAVQMGRAVYEPQRIPLAQTGMLREARVAVAGRTLTLTALSLGNPHAVTFDHFSRGERERLGPALEQHPLFPDRANIGFAELRADIPGLVLHVFERGCGWTQACGTGATAAAIVAVDTGRLPRDTDLAVDLPGGRLMLRVGGDGLATLRGPAVHVFDGVVAIADPLD